LPRTISSNHESTFENPAVYPAGHLLSTRHEDEVMVTINMDSEQKISKTEGNLDGELTVNSEFGNAIAIIGDHGADDGGDLEEEISYQTGNFTGNLKNNDESGSIKATLGNIDDGGITDTGSRRAAG
jgi:hypothetical protein